MTLTTEQVKQFQDEGYLILEDFVDDATVESLKSECHRLIEEMNPADHNTVFSTLEMKRTSDDYFMTSGDKIRYFFEDGAKDEKGNLKVNKHLAINKIGHALHVLSEPFKKVTFSPEIQPSVGSRCSKESWPGGSCSLSEYVHIQATRNWWGSNSTPRLNILIY
ncbi:phytanoyl-CoA dioxygenase domain-containing protein 1 homolog isoform X2 [Ruditapes philippinarum]|uniref:phytanoyl-CoA dioxygenase domain-containing protein 1 homolog isoform X2 n=1 Tax=Ruditapes philippinarum TaxID=129788 RepID=UPI00295BB26E|nr:phytanoyl-CoA dioxygenase domain-containing protein 1 homolog isoform X2 [Ruditapes philippinarum]